MTEVYGEHCLHIFIQDTDEYDGMTILRQYQALRHSQNQFITTLWAQLDGQLSNRLSIYKDFMSILAKCLTEVQLYVCHFSEPTLVLASIISSFRLYKGLFDALF